MVVFVDFDFSFYQVFLVRVDLIVLDLFQLFAHHIGNFLNVDVDEFQVGYHLRRRNFAFVLHNVLHFESRKTEMDKVFSLYIVLAHVEPYHFENNIRHSLVLYILVQANKQ